MLIKNSNIILFQNMYFDGKISAKFNAKLNGAYFPSEYYNRPMYDYPLVVYQRKSIVVDQGGSLPCLGFFV